MMIVDLRIMVNIVIFTTITTSVKLKKIPVRNVNISTDRLPCAASMAIAVAQNVCFSTNIKMAEGMIF